MSFAKPNRQSLRILFVIPAIARAALAGARWPDGMIWGGMISGCWRAMPGNSGLLRR
jgi:hypothetical protein